MKTQGEIESAISDCIGRFEQEYMGRGPKDIHSFLIGDLLVVRMRGVLTATEQHLIAKLPIDKGSDLLKQVRTHLIDLARPTIVALVEGITEAKVVCMHQHICTMTGEEVVLFSLARAPRCREQRISVPGVGEPFRSLNSPHRREVPA